MVAPPLQRIDAERSPFVVDIATQIVVIVLIAVVKSVVGINAFEVALLWCSDRHLVAVLPLRIQVDLVHRSHRSRHVTFGPVLLKPFLLVTWVQENCHDVGWVAIGHCVVLIELLPAKIDTRTPRDRIGIRELVLRSLEVSKAIVHSGENVVQCSVCVVP